MPELRKDPVVGRWVIISTERARRPGTIIDPQREAMDYNQAPCPFCNNQEPEIYAVANDAPGSSSPWKVRVTPSGTPLLKTAPQFKRRGHGLYDVINDYGVHEVVIETPEHIANMADLSEDQITAVFRTYVTRFQELSKNKNFLYVIAYKNYGWAAGSRNIGHSRSQIIASAVNPLVVKEKMAGAKKYFDYHDRCLFCDLIRQESTDGKRVVTESEHFIAISPYAPRFSFETWLLPKDHQCDFVKGVAGKEADLAKILKDVLTRLKVGLDDPSYNYVIHTAPFRSQERGARWPTIEEDYHWHIEVMPRLTRVAGFEKGSGFHICSIPPEHTAEFLREVELP